MSDVSVAAEHWLQAKVVEYEETRHTFLDLPVKNDGSSYRVSDLYDDQKEIAAVISEKIEEWMICTDLSSFKPLRLTVTGAGGSGKSVVINTLVTTIRKIFQKNGVIQVIAPTGTAAANVGGETIHHLLGMTGTDYVNYPVLKRDKRELLKRKFAHLLALIIDERSLLSANVLGAAEHIISKTIHGGHNPSISWGGLPVVVLFGDDYQLPPIRKGVFHAHEHSPNIVTRSGNLVFMELCQKVMELSTSKRIRTTTQTYAKQLNMRLRLGEPSCDDVDRLMRLDLRCIEQLHGKKEVDKIRKNAIHLYALNAKIDEHNINQIIEEHSASNPIAVIRTQSSCLKGGKAKASHFSDGKSNQSALLIRGAKVALQGKNFCPRWGLHNGACGVVEEIIFPKDENPNSGAVPSYVVVNFPAYCGPIWDKDSPKVSRSIILT